MTENERKGLAKIKPKKRCAYCHGTENLTYDHKHPLALGGTDDPKNIQVLCYPCNSLKSNIPHGTLMRILRWYEDTKRTRVKPWPHEKDTTHKKDSA